MQWTLLNNSNSIKKEKLFYKIIMFLNLLTGMILEKLLSLDQEIYHKDRHTRVLVGAKSC